MNKLTESERIKAILKESHQRRTKGILVSNQSQKSTLELTQQLLDDTLDVVEEMELRATALEKIIDTAELRIPNDQLTDYYESLDQI